MLLAPVGGAPCGMWAPDSLEHPETLFRASRIRASGLSDRRASRDSAACVEARALRYRGPGRDARARPGHRSGPASARGHPVAASPRQPLHAQAGSPLSRVTPPGGVTKTKSGYGPRVGRPTGIVRPADPIGLIVGVPIRLPLPSEEPLMNAPIPLHLTPGFPTLFTVGGCKGASANRWSPLPCWTTCCGATRRCC